MQSGCTSWHTQSSGPGSSHRVFFPLPEGGATHGHRRSIAKLARGVSTGGRFPPPPLPQLEAWSFPRRYFYVHIESQGRERLSPADRSLTNRKWILSPVDPRLTPRRKPPSPNRDDRYMEERE